MLRHFGLLLVGVLAAATVLVLVVWEVPSLLTQGRALAGAERYKAMADVRTGLAATLTAAGAVGGLAYTAGTFRLSQAGQFIGRFESASKQMGDSDLVARLAGIYAMAQLADEWVKQRQTCIDVLCAFLRVTGDPLGSQSDDLWAARRTTLRIIKSHLSQRPGQVSWQEDEFDLRGAVLKEVDFTGITFAGGRFFFDGAQFEEDVSFADATFAGGYVSFCGAKLLKPGSHVSFERCLFRGGKVVFEDVTLGGGEVRFNDATFEPDCLVDFKGAQLGAGGSVYFNGATVHGPGLRFTNACFSGDGEVRFEHVTFSGTVYFDGAEFDRDVHFDCAKLVGATLLFAGTKWHKGRIIFDGADCTDLTIDLEKPVIGTGSIDLRKAEGTPRIIGTDPVPPLVLLRL